MKVSTFLFFIRNFYLSSFLSLLLFLKFFYWISFNVMAASEVPTPSQTPSFTSLISKPEPVSLERLDSLLEAYLELLDEYTSLRTQLSKQFSEGFFALARANHTSNNLGSGRRYGEEGYDERMKAQSRIMYSVKNSV